MVDNVMLCVVGQVILAASNWDVKRSSALFLSKYIFSDNIYALLR